MGRRRDGETERRRDGETEEESTCCVGVLVRQRSLAVYQFGIITPRTLVQRLLKGHVMAVAFDADTFTSQPS